MSLKAPKPIPEWNPIPICAKVMDKVDGKDVRGCVWLAALGMLYVSFEGYERYAMKIDAGVFLEANATEILSKAWQQLTTEIGIVITPPPPKIITLS